MPFLGRLVGFSLNSWVLKSLAFKVISYLKKTITENLANNHMRFIRLSSSQETSLFLRCHLTNGAFSVHGQTPVSLCTSSQNNSKINRTRDRLNCLSFISKLVSLHPRAVKGKYGNVVLRRHINTVKSSHQVRPLKHS